jgi:hypothetical protein
MVKKLFIWLSSKLNSLIIKFKVNFIIIYIRTKLIIIKIVKRIQVFFEDIQDKEKFEYMKASTIIHITLIIIVIAFWNVVDLIWCLYYGKI